MFMQLAFELAQNNIISIILPPANFVCTSEIGRIINFHLKQGANFCQIIVLVFISQCPCPPSNTVSNVQAEILFSVWFLTDLIDALQ